ncbi:MAG: class I poly(R)-hydroxyalkanoic acid synthase, partial [Advenella sp.]
MTNETDKAWRSQADRAPGGVFPSRLQAEFLERWEQIAADAREGTLPALTDRRFSSPAWQTSPQHLMMAHLYLLSTKVMQKMVDEAAVPDS